VLHLTFFDLTSPIMCGEEYKSWSSLLFNFYKTFCYFLNVMSKCSIQHFVLKHPQWRLHFKVIRTFKFSFQVLKLN
jgi:hypothetical protein